MPSVGGWAGNIGEFFSEANLSPFWSDRFTIDLFSLGLLKYHKYSASPHL